jgi:hypothetical protein
MTVNVLRKARIKPEKPLPPAQRELVLQYVERSVPDKHKIATQRALLGQITRSTAIRIKCLQCCNYDRESVKECGVYSCALHPVRPYQSKTVEDTDEQND